MRIGVIIGRIGGVDGVALETEKWVEVLRRLGHEVFMISGLYEKPVLPPERQTLVPDLSFLSPQCEWEQSKAFFAPGTRSGALLQGIDDSANDLCDTLVDWIRNNRIEALLSENASALPCHLSMGVAIKRVVQKTGLPTVAHDHDFAWERGERYTSPHPHLNSLVADTFPLILPGVTHAVINSAARETLRRRFGIDAVVVPNVMDFARPYAVADDYNRTLLADLGVGPDDVPLMQVTRVVRRKGIETAIALVHALEDAGVKLVITGGHHDDETRTYRNDLLHLIRVLKLDGRVVFAGHRFAGRRATDGDGRKMYTIEDAYARGRACTYFSTYEGFGNAFVEAVLARKPIFVNNYKPVFWPDIGSKGFRTVMIEDGCLTDEAVADIRRIIRDPDLCREIAEENFRLGKEHFSYDVLERSLSRLFHQPGK